VVKTWTNTGSTEEKKTTLDSPRIDLLCRICEELVPSNMLEEHSNSCAIKHNIQMKTISVDDRFKKLQTSMRKRIEQIQNKKQNSTLHEIELLNRLIEICKEVCKIKYNNESIEQMENFISELNGKIYYKLTRIYYRRSRKKRNFNANINIFKKSRRSFKRKI
jgi:hypothetical protein